MKKFVCMICIVLLTAVIFASCGNSGSTPDEVTPEATTPEETVIDEMSLIKCVPIETPYATLQVAEDFDREVKASVNQEDPFILDFVTVDDGTVVFSLHFSDKTDNLLGTLQLGDENIIIYADFPEFDAKDEDYQRNLGYQMQVSVIMYKLIEDYDFLPNVAIGEENNDVFRIETSVTDLFYPKKWEDKVTVTVGADKVSFSAEETPLFDLYFKAVNGVQVGSYGDTPIYIVEYEVEDSEHAAMLQDVNVIIQYLSKDQKFTTN